MSRALRTRTALRWAALLLLAAGMPAATHAQDQLSLSISDPVYAIIEYCGIRGLIPHASAVKPYARGEVREYLEGALAASEGLTPRQRTLLRQLRDRLGRAEPSAPRAQLALRSTLRFDLAGTSGLHAVNLVEAALKGSLGSSLSYDMNLGVFLDKVDPEAFPPYAYTKIWDGFHIWAEGGSVLISDGVNDHLNFSFRTLPELSLELLDGRARLSLSRRRQQWGVGQGSLSLSGTARPLQALGGRVRINPWSSFHFLIGAAGDWWDWRREQKMLSIHRLELLPLPWLYLSPWESVVWAKRFELSYLNPLMSYYMGQQLIGDMDNVAFGGEAAVTIAPYLRLYVSLFIDELVLTDLQQFFTRANNQYAWQAGLKVPIPWPAFSLLTLQYTKIEPYCYTHYPQSLPQYSTEVDIAFTNDGENIGYHLPPNSDELLVRLFTYPLTGLSATAQYQLIRHGSGSHLAGQIEGDIDAWLDYGSPVPYPPKDFLHDGLYERLNVLTLKVAYTLAPLLTTVWAQYSYVNGKNYGNVAGNDVQKHLVGLGLRVDYPPGP